MTTAVATRESKNTRNWLDREPLATLREDLDSLLSRFFEGGENRSLPGRAVPALELSETDAEVRVRLDVPGMKPDDFDIQIVGNTLTVCGTRKEEKEEKGRTYHRVERRTSEFSRSVTLPGEVDDQRVDATYKDGVLTVTMQKTETSKARKIKIKA